MGSARRDRPTRTPPGATQANTKPLGALALRPAEMPVKSFYILLAAWIKCARRSKLRMQRETKSDIAVTACRDYARVSLAALPGHWLPPLVVRCPGPRHSGGPATVHQKVHSET